MERKWNCYFSLLLFFTLSVVADVNFDKIPNCARNSCFPFRAASIGCTKFTTDCFCNRALAPLSCASKSCVGDDWFELEDWFNTICPNPQLVDLGTMPACSRTCIRTAIIPGSCPAFSDDTQSSAPKITRNCFCRLNETFTGLTACLVDGCLLNATQAAIRLQEQYTRTCVYSLGVKSDSGGSNTGNEVIKLADADGSQGDGLSPVEWFGVMAGIIASFITLVGAYISLRRWRKIKRKQTSKSISMSNAGGYH